jgi:hypothetical protein
MHRLQRSVADLVAEAPRTCMNQDKYLAPVIYAESPGCVSVVDLVNNLDLEEVIA